MDKLTFKEVVDLPYQSYIYKVALEDLVDLMSRGRLKSKRENIWVPMVYIKMSFDEIFDLTAGVYFNFHNIIFLAIHAVAQISPTHAPPTAPPFPTTRNIA